jgi:hypothetical protein
VFLGSGTVHSMPVFVFHSSAVGPLSSVTARARAIPIASSHVSNDEPYRRQLPKTVVRSAGQVRPGETASLGWWLYQAFPRTLHVAFGSMVVIAT